MVFEGGAWTPLPGRRPVHTWKDESPSSWRPGDRTVLRANLQQRDPYPEGGCSCGGAPSAPTACCCATQRNAWRDTSARTSRSSRPKDCAFLQCPSLSWYERANVIEYHAPCSALWFAQIIQRMRPILTSCA